MSQNPETRRIQHPAMLAVGQRPDVLIWRQQSGLFYTADGVPVRVGMPGLSDAMMVVDCEVTPDMVGKRVGLAVAIEFKTPKGRQSPAQKNFQAAVEKRHGIYWVIRSAGELVELVKGLTGKHVA